tara:strand:+ start:2905 stop:3552 length:648 start_codon:yes stop_codon:yes gene_type:complete
LKINESEFKGKTFNAYSSSEIDTLIIDFQDSTHQIFGGLWSGKIPWRISHYDETNILVLDNRLIGIKINPDNSLDCISIGLTDKPFKMSERKPKWKKDYLYGTWIEEKFIETDSTDFPPPPRTQNLKINWPPSYTITEKEIVFDYYKKSESKIQIPNSADFIQMNLRHPLFNQTDYNWIIEYLSDDLMVVIKDFEVEQLNNNTRDSEKIRLIKKR